MERLTVADGSSKDIVEENVAKLQQLFPEAFTEGKVDLDVLRDILGDYVEERDERYSFTWHGKSRARRLAQTPSTGTLRPCPEESVNWDTTQNLFIEGDNLEVLKLLQKSYHKKVKMIYIDPPYNTGNDFVYRDDFRDNLQAYLRYTGQVDEEGHRVSTNAETSGRYHTNWLNMMYPRLRLARNLLRDDGVIFISIDDHEVANLRKMCDEIFGEENFVAAIVWERAFSPKNDAKYFSDSHDYIVVYAKNLPLLEIGRLERTAEADARYSNPDDDPRGPWTSGDLSVKTYSAEYDYPITTPGGRVVSPPHGSCWRVSRQRFQELVADGRIWFGKSGRNVPRLKRFLSEVTDGIVPTTFWTHEAVGHNQEGRQEVKALFDDRGYFDGPKPVRLLSRILRVANVSPGDIVVDFFAGSATTAHATLRWNHLHGGNRRFIMIQLPERCEETSEAYRAGYETIADIGKERIRRVIKQIQSERAADGEPDSGNLDLGFKVFKLDSSNIKPWDGNVDDLEQGLFDAVDNIKPDRSEDDVLYELLLKYGLDLAVPIDERVIEGKRVHVIGAGALVVCLADGITLPVVKGIAALKEELQPEVMRVVFKDNGFEDDVVKTNAVQVLRLAGIDDVRSL